MDDIDAGQKLGVVSVASLFEILVKPFEARRLDLVDTYKRRFHENPHVRARAVDLQVAEEAARIRAKYRIKTAPDTIQHATAKRKGIDAFVTNDKDLRRFEELP